METQVKERLTGAIILVGVLVLLVPELLTGPKPVEAPAAPSADEPPLRSYTIDLNEDGSAKRAPAAAVVDASESPQPMGANSEVTDEASDASVEDALPSDEPDVEPPMSNQSAEEADSAPAAANVSKPEPARAGPKDTVPSVRTEPAASKPEPAKTASAKAERPDQAPVPGVVKAAPAEQRTASAPASKPSAEEPASKASATKPVAPKESPPKAAKGSGWAIQVGSFVSRANADRLANELKGKGFAAFVSESTRGGKKLFRVRVGPEADKAAAQSLAAKLRAAGRSGSLVPHS